MERPKAKRYSSVCRIHFNNNPSSDWTEVGDLHLYIILIYLSYSSLSHLIHSIVLHSLPNFTLHFPLTIFPSLYQIETLGQMFPYLEVLILAECPLSQLKKGGRYHEFFPSLKYLSLNSTKICSWDSVDLVNHFPKLSELRLQQCPLYEVRRELLFSNFFIFVLFILSLYVFSL